jgi:hypothetical protein
MASTTDFTDVFLGVTQAAPAKARNDLRRALRNVSGSDAERGKMLQILLMEELAPVVRNLPVLVQEILGRVFVENVNWERMATAICIDPQEN